MLKYVLRRWKDDGAILHDGQELPVAYEIEARGNRNSREASGTVTGLSPGESHRILTGQRELRLRLSSGDVVDIAFLGGQIGGAAKIVVNSPMPGLD